VILRLGNFVRGSSRIRTFFFNFNEAQMDNNQIASGTNIDVGVLKKQKRSVPYVSSGAETGPFSKKEKIMSVEFCE
jgi:hypothetical protein